MVFGHKVASARFDSRIVPRILLFDCAHSYAYADGISSEDSWETSAAALQRWWPLAPAT